MIPVIDMRKRLEMEVREYTDRTRIIVSEINSKSIGLIVDEVLEVMRVPNRQIEKIPYVLKKQYANNCMQGIANIGTRMIITLDLENILREKEWKQLSKIGEAGQDSRKISPNKEPK